LETSAGETPVSNDHYIDSGDLVRIVGDRVLFLGRKNRSINVGVNKVMPEAVEAVLLQHDAVVAARVYGKPSTLTGSLVAADIELKPGHTLANERHSILAACHNALERWQVPALLHVVESIAIGPGGKVARSSNA
jgi:acyl-CoA synthetase (AMP-forming)/AMP-acid ligase II